MADITVQVTSPGLTAYGNNSWGSLSYGGDNINIISTGSDAVVLEDEFST